jgi:hypothetical protein
MNDQPPQNPLCCPECDIEIDYCGEYLVCGRCDREYHHSRWRINPTPITTTT